METSAPTATSRAKTYGAFWLGSVPQQWDLVPAWTIWCERNERCHENDVHLTPSQSHGVMSQQAFMEITGNKVVLNLSGSGNMKHVEPGDFIIHLRSFQGGLEYSELTGKVSNAYTVLRPAVELNPSYYRWLFKSSAFVSGLAGSTDQLRDGQSINFKRFSTFTLPHPDLKTQRRIADYLDAETSQIDTLVAELDGYVELLAKRKVLIIVEKTRIKENSCEYSQLGWHASVVLGKTKQSTQKNINEVHLKYVRAGNIQPNGIFEGEEKSMWFTPFEASQYSLQKGDVLVVEGGAGFGRSLTLQSDLDGWGFQNHVIRIRPDEGWNSQFLDYVIRAYKATGYIDLLAVGATIPGFSAEKAKKLRVPFLPVDEQTEIADQITKELTSIDTIITECIELKELLLKRRQVLITDVVTGKVEV